MARPQDITAWLLSHPIKLFMQLIPSVEVEVECLTFPLAPFQRRPLTTASTVSPPGWWPYAPNWVKVVLKPEAIEFHARVVWIETLPAGGPAVYDVGLEFLELSDGAKQHLGELLADK